MKLNIGVPNSMHVAAMTQPWEHSLSGAEEAKLWLQLKVTRLRGMPVLEQMIR